jgi:serine/threonine protein kinase/WD40 repeat protein
MTQSDDDADDRSDLSSTCEENAGNSDIDSTVSTSRSAGAADANGAELKKIGNYQICRVIGRGGMGLVYEATDLRLGRQVALKVMPPAARLDKSRTKRFRNESRVAAKLNHENIVPVYNDGRADGVQYFAMQLVKGRNLSQVIKQIRDEISSPTGAKSPETSKESTLKDGETGKPEGTPAIDRKQSSARIDSPKELRFEFSASEFSRRSSRHTSSARVANSVAGMGYQVADALHHAHELGIIHRDIKPSNLMLDIHGKIWVTDFGLAHIINSPTLTRAGDILGTYRYMSPEQASGVRALTDHRTDIYSLAVTLSEVLLLKPLVGGENREEILKQVVFGAPVSIRRMNSSVPDDLAIILEKAMSKNPLDRYTTAREMADDLKRFLDHDAIKARRPNVFKRCRHWFERHKGVAAAAGMAFAAIFLTAIVSAGVILQAWNGTQLQLVQTKKALSVSEGLRLLTHAAMLLPENAGLSLILSITGAVAAPGPEANQVVQSACDAVHEYASTTPREMVSNQIAISPDGQSAISCISDGVPFKVPYPALIHSMKDGRLLATLNTDAITTSAAFSPTGRFILTMSQKESSTAKNSPPQSATLWDAATRKTINAFEVSSRGRAPNGIFHPELDQVRLCLNNEAVVFEISKNLPSVTLRGHAAPVFYAEFSPDGKRVCTVSDDLTIRIWSAETGKETRPPIPWVRTPLRNISAYFTAASDALIVCDGRIATRHPALQDDAPSGKLPFVSALKIAVSRSHGHVAVYSKNKATILSSKTLEFISQLDVASDISDVRFHPSNAQTLLLCGRTMKLLNSETGNLVSEFKGHDFTVNDADMYGPSGVIASVANDGTLKLWHIQTGLDQRSFKLPGDEAFYVRKDRSYTLSPGDEWIAVPTRRDFYTTLRDSNGGKLPGEWYGMATRDVSNNDPLVYIAGKTVAVSEKSTSREIFRATFGDVLTSDTRLVDKGRKLLVSTFSEGAVLVNTASRSRQRLGLPANSVTQTAISDDSTIAILVADDGTFTSVDTNSGKINWVRYHELPIVDLDIASDMQTLALLDSSGTIEIWPLVGNEPSKTIKISDMPVDHVSVLASPESILCWSRLNNREVRCYKADSSFIKFEAEGEVTLDTCQAHPFVAIGTSQGAFLWNVTDESTRRIAEGATRSICVTKDRVAVMLAPTADDPSSLLIRSITDDQITHTENLDLSPWSIQADENGDHFIVTQLGYSAEVFDFQTCEHKYASSSHPTPIVWTGFSKKTRNLMTISEDGTLLRTDDLGRLIRRAHCVEEGDTVTAAALSEDGGTLIVGTKSGTIAVRSATEATLDRQLIGHPAAIKSIRLDGGGKRGISVAADGSARFWDLVHQKEYDLKLEKVAHAEISSSGSHSIVVTGDANLGELTAWLVDNDKQESIQLNPSESIRIGRFSPDGSQCGLLMSSGALEVLRTADQVKLCTIPGTYERASKFAFSPDGKLILLAKSRVCELWSISNCKKELEVGHEITRFDINATWTPFDHSGNWIITQDEEVRKRPLHLLDFAEKIVPRQLTEEERRRFKLNVGAEPSVD